jgi:2-pyrone-4,6-dicarboxylate lactonase
LTVDDATTSAPPPSGSCDCQVHIFGDVGKYPLAAGRAYDPPQAAFADMAAAHRAAGIDRAVIVQATAYGTDHRLLLETLQDKPNCRGVATVDDSVSDADLSVLHQAGVRGARFGLGASLQTALNYEEFKRSIARIRAFGWHAKIVSSADDLVKHLSWLEDLHITVVLDHLAGVTPSKPQEQEAVGRVLDLLRRQDFWIMISNADRRSTQSSIWDDMRPLIDAYVSAAPDRTIWATDWPHLRYARPAVPTITDLVGFLVKSVPDETARKKILVDNPARLYEFTS